MLVLEGTKKRVWILNSNEVKNVSLQDEKRLWDRFNFIMWILFFVVKWASSNINGLKAFVIKPN